MRAEKEREKETISFQIKEHFSHRNKDLWGGDVSRQAKEQERRRRKVRLGYKTNQLLKVTRNRSVYSVTEDMMIILFNQPKDTFSSVKTPPASIHNKPGTLNSLIDRRTVQRTTVRPSRVDLNPPKTKSIKS